MPCRETLTSASPGRRAGGHPLPAAQGDPARQDRRVGAVQRGRAACVGAARHGAAEADNLQLDLRQRAPGRRRAARALLEGRRASRRGGERRQDWLRAVHRAGERDEVGGGLRRGGGGGR
eukprot:3928037-Prymnesium_polylepis.1